ncbi:MAG TPA: 23S rRNA (pseudouridine(1915)-N(3))-methyltransferase RlmH [Patescibacteria group bacterium]|nr:23S rRNA (pseudouridine(1915)-N(3))-methyltransferase RlmH [Patescibacteria group bacterium]
MFHVTLLTIGKQKSGPYADLVSDYLKRLSPYAKVHRRELPEIRFHSVADRNKVLDQEMALIRDAVRDDGVMIVLDADGKQFDSAHFAAKLKDLSEQETRPLVFVVGGPLGLHDELKAKCDLSLSLSPMTMPHELAMVVLSEQIYRAMTILTNKTYHY